MTTATKKGIPSLLRFWTADEVAECLSVKDETYKELWTKVVPQQEKDQNADPTIQEVGYMEYPDQKWGFALARYWSMLSEDAQDDIRDACIKHDDELGIDYQEIGDEDA